MARMETYDVNIKITMSLFNLFVLFVYKLHHTHEKFTF